MKNLVIGILVLVSAALGGLLLQKHSQLRQAEQEIATLKQEAEDLVADRATQEHEATVLREKLDKSLAESAANAGTAAQLSVALTNRVEAEEATNAKPANPFAEMFKNKEMREMIREQQKTVLGGMLDKNYADFFKAMNLTPEQTATMKNLLMEKMLGGAELGMEMMSGEMTAEQRTELTKKLKETTEAIDQQLKDLLGEENYSQFQAYEKSVPDRMALEQFKGQLTAEMALNSSQEQSLLAAISEERLGFKFTTDYSNQQDFSEDMFSKFTEERMDLYFQEQDQLNQRILARVQPILSADQYNAYAKSLKSQQDMMKMGMKMAASMFGKKK